MQVSDTNTERAAGPATVRRLRADQARQVADILRHQILAGAFGDTLPSEHRLATEHETSRNTVREALALLRDEGLIARAPRVGTRVAARKYDHGL
ncbi:winged helix-turn-helix domain-containing protein, partial [Nocardia sp. NPDC003345]